MSLSTATEILTETLTESVHICLFVILMMSLIEIFNVGSRGKLFTNLGKHPFGQILISSVLGVIPGCAGGFAVVSLYSHRMVGFGALLAMMIATTGDEAFLMLTMFPGKALWLFALLFVMSVVIGYVTDRIISRHKDGELHLGEDRDCSDNYEIHSCDCEEHSHDHHHGEGWGHRCLHFLKDHIWKHVIRRHLPTIFAWTFGVLLLVGILEHSFDLENWIKGNTGIMILIAVLLGFIPESGPHIIFVTMFASGVIPFPVLLANSLSQDGHACLPLLAENKMSFVYTKLIKSVIALAVSYGAMFIC